MQVRLIPSGVAKKGGGMKLRALVFTATFLLAGCSAGPSAQSEVPSAQSEVPSAQEACELATIYIHEMGASIRRANENKANDELRMINADNVVSIAAQAKENIRSSNEEVEKAIFEYFDAHAENWRLQSVPLAEVDFSQFDITTEASVTKGAQLLRVCTQYWEE